MDDLFDEFLEYDFAMGADALECPYCGAEVPYSLFFDSEIECPECGRRFQNNNIE